MINYQALEDVKEAIRKEPESLNMKSWHHWKCVQYQCHTTHCIAGWLAVLNYPLRIVKEAEKKGLATQSATQSLAASALNLDPLNRRLELLFDVDNWPDLFRDMYNWAETQNEMVEAACLAIDDWMLTQWRRENRGK